MGLEPATSGLQYQCSTNWANTHYDCLPNTRFFFTSSGTRNPLFKSDFRNRMPVFDEHLPIFYVYGKVLDTWVLFHKIPNNNQL